MNLLRGNAARLAPFAVLLLVLAAALVVEPDFYDTSNLAHVSRGAAFLAVVALGQLMVIIVRGLDLSVGAVITATLLLVVELAGTRDGRLGRALLAVLVMALVVGATNAVLVVGRRVPAILATLATFVLLDGLGVWFTGGRSRGRVPELLRPLGTGSIGPVPLAVVVAVVLAVAVAVILGRTPFGRAMYAVGANPDASYLAGVPRRRVAALAFIASSLLAMVAGLMLSGYVGFYDRTIGVGYDLDSIAAAILGGASFAGGVGSVGGTMAAVVGLAALDNLLLIAGVGPAVQLLGKGLVLFAAVLSAGWLTARPSEAAHISPDKAGTQPIPGGEAA